MDFKIIFASRAGIWCSSYATALDIHIFPYMGCGQHVGSEPADGRFLCVSLSK